MQPQPRDAAASRGWKRQRTDSFLKPPRDCSAAAAAKSLQSCPTLSDPMDCSPPGFSVHGIFQARVLKWGPIAFSVVLPTTHFWPRDVVLDFWTPEQ